MKVTSGGRWDANSKRLYFLAGQPNATDKSKFPHVLAAVNELDTPKARDAMDRMLDEGRLVLLDSGIFNLAMGYARENNIHMDDALRLPPDEIAGFDELRDSYYRTVTLYADRLWGFIELDQGGKDVKPTTRATIEKDLGLTPMPVYHPLLDGPDYHRALAEEYDRICFGNLVKASPSDRTKLMMAAYMMGREHPHLWQHLLGVHPSEKLISLPMRGSFDSSSWLTSLRWMPSWKTWAMLKMDGSFPPDMWYGEGKVEEGELLNAATAFFTQLTLDALGEDTHPCTF